MAVIRSGRELLAAAGAAGTKHLAAADGGRAGAEAVATGADKAAGLERTLHFKNLRNLVVCGAEPGSEARRYRGCPDESIDESLVWCANRIRDWLGNTGPLPRPNHPKGTM